MHCTYSFDTQVSGDPLTHQNSLALGSLRPDPARATALSLLKASSSSSRALGTKEKIRAMEQKLEQMQGGSFEDKIIPNEVAGLPDKPLPSLIQAAELSAERAREASKAKKHRVPVKATEAVIGRPVTEILKINTGAPDNAQSGRSDGNKSNPKPSLNRKQLGIRTLQGVKLVSKR
jgi:hypothetical protein